MNRWRIFAKFLLATVFAATAVAPLTSHAAELCANLVDSPAAGEHQLTGRPRDFKSYFLKNLLGPDPLLDLDFIWNIPHPSFKQKYGGKPNRDYVSDPLEPTAPVVGIARLFGNTAIDSSEFYRSVYRGYHDKYRDDLIRILYRVDAKLNPERLSIGKVHDISTQRGQRGRVLGTFRAYDGSQKPWGLQYVDDNRVIRPHGDLLPFQRVNRARGIAKLRIEDELLAKIEQGTKVFELGKFQIVIPSEKARAKTTEEDPRMHHRVRALIEAFWLEKIVRQFSPDAIYVAHVIDQKYEERFRERYGFEVVERFMAPGAPDPERIMIATGATLERRLQNLTWNPHVD